jgi:hypothetical protein
MIVYSIKKSNSQCKLNRANAFDNRLDDNICGKDAKQFSPLDKKYLPYIEHTHIIFKVCGTATLAAFLFQAKYLLLFGMISTPISAIFNYYYYEMYCNRNYIDREDR